MKTIIVVVLLLCFVGVCHGFYHDYDVFSWNPYRFRRSPMITDEHGFEAMPDGFDN